MNVFKSIESNMGRVFGNEKNPLLLSVRSGARISMPGMMETVLNIGLNTETSIGLIKKTKNPQFVYDSHLLPIYHYHKIYRFFPIHIEDIHDIQR